MKDLLDRLWQHHDAECDLALEAEENGWPDAFSYHKERASQYLALINSIVETREEAKDEHDEHDDSRQR